MISQLKRLIPRSSLEGVRSVFHFAKAQIAAARYGYPAKKLVLIGITGTKGKTSTTVTTGRLLNLCGIKTGYISTAEICDGVTTISNPYHMTTIDAVQMQKTLNIMVKSGCTHAVIEMSSQGLAQHRHQGLAGFDIAAFLNLFPEHIEAHGSLEKYALAKAILFENLRPCGIALIKSTALKADMMLAHVPPHAQGYFVDTTHDFTVVAPPKQLYKTIKINSVLYKSHFSASFELENLYFALKIAQLVVSPEQSTQKNLDRWDVRVLQHISELGSISGRMEFVVESEKIDIMIDYAHEPESMKQLLNTLTGWKKEGVYSSIVHVVSCDGAGRDDWKKPIMGEISYQNADFTIFTTDNYEQGDNPEQIVALLTQNLEKNLTHGVGLANRTEAFEMALSVARKKTRAQKKVLIVSTGVGNEHGLTRPEGRIPWNEKEVWQQLLGVKKTALDC